MLGIDITSSPSPAKPLWVASCVLDGDTLRVGSLQPWNDLDVLRSLLAGQGPWIMGLDFPFGLPRAFVRNVGWGSSWTDIALRATRDRQASLAEIIAFRERAPVGSKHPLRATDRVAKSHSPVNIVRPAVGKMYLACVGQLASSDVSVRPCRPMPGDRVVVEAYPALVAERLVGSRHYKDGSSGVAQAERDGRRAALVRALFGASMRSGYGFTVDVARGHQEAMGKDRGGDMLDSVLCSVQAAWAWRNREHNYGMPRDCDAIEGWIADPATQEGS